MRRLLVVAGFVLVANLASADDEQGLVYLCGRAGLSVNFATGTCIVPRTQQSVNPYELVPEFQWAPNLPAPSDNDDLWLVCGGRPIDPVTGRCL